MVNPDSDDRGRLEDEVRERWGENWTIRTHTWADGSSQSVAFRSRGEVNPDAESDDVIVERERLLFVDDGRLVRDVVHVQQRRVLDTLESDVVGHRGEE